MAADRQPAADDGAAKPAEQQPWSGLMPEAPAPEHVQHPGDRLGRRAARFGRRLWTVGDIDKIGAASPELCPTTADHQMAAEVPDRLAALARPAAGPAHAVELEPPGASGSNEQRLGGVASIERATAMRKPAAKPSDAPLAGHHRDLRLRDLRRPQHSQVLS